MTKPTDSIDSSTWLQEFTPYLNGKRVKWPDLHLNLLEGEVCELTLDYEYSWLIGDPDAFICMEYVSGEAGQGLVFDPPLGQELKMAEGSTSLTWMITSAGAPSGSHILQFAIPRMGEMPKSPPVPIAVLNIAQELDIKFDTFSLDVGGAAYPCHGASHRLTIAPKAGSRLLDKKIKLQMIGNALGVGFEPPLADEHLLTSHGVAWNIDCLKTTENVGFTFRLIVAETGQEATLATMQLGHNLVTVERWEIERSRWPDIVWFQKYLRASSAFLKKPVKGVPVDKAATGFFKNTDANGEVTTSITTSDGRLVVVNKYDGTIV